MAMKYQIVPVTPFEQNCCLLWCDATLCGAVVDPGGDVTRILSAAERNGVTLEKILVTHGHIDHAGAVADLANRLSVPVEGPQYADKFWIDGLPQQSRMYGFPNVRAFTPDRWLEHGIACILAISHWTCCIARDIRPDTWFLRRPGPAGDRRRRSVQGFGRPHGFSEG